MASERPSLTIILCEPEHPGNIGAVARVMANFDCKKLVLVNPVADHLSSEARNRAKHAQKILDRAVVTTSIPFDEFDLVVATSGKLGNDYNLPRIPLSPRQLAEELSRTDKTSIAILFGPESKGLSNDQIRRADMFLTILSSKKYPILNLSHSVGIVLYELFQSDDSAKESFEKRFPLATRKHRDLMEGLMNSVIDGVDFSTPEQKETQKILWRRIFSKSFITRREAFAIIGLLKKIGGVVDDTVPKKKKDNS